MQEGHIPVTVRLAGSLRRRCRLRTGGRYYLLAWRLPTDRLARDRFGAGHREVETWMARDLDGGALRFEGDEGVVAMDRDRRWTHTRVAGRALDLT